VRLAHRPVLSGYKKGTSLPERGSSGSRISTEPEGALLPPDVLLLRLVDTSEPAAPITWDADLGWVLYDVFDLSRQSASHADPSVSIFRALVRSGRMAVPLTGRRDVGSLRYVWKRYFALTVNWRVLAISLPR
jgi:hypothetical protein